MTPEPTTIFLADAAIDAMGTFQSPAAVVVRAGRIAGVLSPNDPALQAYPQAARIALKPSVILPAMVNAHAHLDLTSIGPVPYQGDFPAWLKQVVQQRPAGEEAIVRSVEQGLALSQQAGVMAIGDIAGSVAAVKARLNAPGNLALPGVSFLECFGLGQRQNDAMDYLAESLAGVTSPRPWMQVGIQPHAPYSVGPELYRRIARLAREKGYRLSTHLAESPEELEFVRQATGPLADLLHRIGKWDDSIRRQQAHPADTLADVWKDAPWLLAHGNYLSKDHARLLADAQASVAYCPIASDYFGYPHEGPHPYQTLLDQGVNVALGTDSILCQPLDQSQPMGLLPAMRLLYRRDRTDPMRLLTMASVNGAMSLGLPRQAASLRPESGWWLGMIQVPVDQPPTISTADSWLKQILRSDAPVRPLEATVCPCPDASGSSASAPSGRWA